MLILVYNIYNSNGDKLRVLGNLSAALTTTVGYSPLLNLDKDLHHTPSHIRHVSPRYQLHNGETIGVFFGEPEKD